MVYIHINMASHEKYSLYHQYDTFVDGYCKLNPNPKSLSYSLQNGMMDWYDHYV